MHAGFSFVGSGLSDPLAAIDPQKANATTRFAADGTSAQRRHGPTFRRPLNAALHWLSEDQ